MKCRHDCGWPLEDHIPGEGCPPILDRIETVLVEDAADPIREVVVRG